MRVHYLIHNEAEMPGAITTWANRNNFSQSFTILSQDQPLPDIDSFDLLVIMGGPMNIYEDDVYNWLKPEKAFIKKSMDQGKKVFGICLGAQLIADVLGAKVFKNITTEIGWYHISLTTEGEKSELVGNLNFSTPVLHWHGDTFSIPENAIHLLQSEACQNQAFSYNDNVLALQFHFEMNSDSLQTIIKLDRNSLQKSEWVMTEEEIIIGIENIERNNETLFSLLNKFISQ
jgi:GMP synthase-like glutamine amidotransferase